MFLRVTELKLHSHIHLRIVHRDKQIYHTQHSHNSNEKKQQHICKNKRPIYVGAPILIIVNIAP